MSGSKPVAPADRAAVIHRLAPHRTQKELAAILGMPEHQVQSLCASLRVNRGHAGKAAKDMAPLYVETPDAEAIHALAGKWV